MSRLKFVWTRAPRLPQTMETTATPVRTNPDAAGNGGQNDRTSIMWTRNAKAAILDAVAMNMATTEGAPS